MNRFPRDLARAFGLVAATFNPTGWCYTIWIQHRPDLPASVVVVFGSALVAGWMYYIRSVKGALGVWPSIGLFLFLWAVLWMLTDLGLIPPNADKLWGWLAVLVTALTFAVGASWPELRKARLKRRASRSKTGDWLNF